MAHDAYGPTLAGPLWWDEELYRRYPEATVCIYDADRPVGCVTIHPVAESWAEGLVDGERREYDLKFGQDILSQEEFRKHPPRSWYLSNVLVSPEYRGLGLSKDVLREGLVRLLDSTLVYPMRILTLTVSPGGEHAFRSLGFERICEAGEMLDQAPLYELRLESREDASWQIDRWLSGYLAPAD